MYFDEPQKKKKELYTIPKQKKARKGHFMPLGELDHFTLQKEGQGLIHWFRMQHSLQPSIHTRIILYYIHVYINTYIYIRTNTYVAH